MKHFTTVLAVLSLAMACGKSSENKSSSSNDTTRALELQEEAPLDGSNIQGHYQAKFTTLNPHVNGTIPGSANFFRKDDKIFAYVRLFAGGVKAWHMQHVYEGQRCPTMADDTNGDGFIDILEAEAVLGKVLIPLDSNISSQSSGKRLFPLADLSGYYHYERVASFKVFLKDLMDADPDTTDNITKLPPGEGLRITGKVFMVQGISESVDLPETVATKDKRRAFQTLPIACGVFAKVESAPGQAYVQDEIPGPVAEVDPNQDRPAGDVDPGPATGGTGSGGSNESDSGNGPISDGREGSGRSTGNNESRTSSSSSSSSTTSSSTSSSTTGSTTSGGRGRTTTSSSTSSTTGDTTTGGTSSGETSSGDESEASTSSSSSSSSGGTTEETTDSSSGI